MRRMVKSPVFGLSSLLVVVVGLLDPAATGSMAAIWGGVGAATAHMVSTFG